MTTNWHRNTTVVSADAPLIADVAVCLAERDAYLQMEWDCAVSAMR